MKIKNLRINQKLMTKLSSCVLVGSLTVMTLTGCSSNDIITSDNLLKGTILENARVITFENGRKEIAVVDSFCIKTDYNHYYSIVSGEYFSDKNCGTDLTRDNCIYKYTIISDESITKYLTKDDLIKANKGELIDDDVINIVIRIINPTIENKIKTK